MTCFSLFHIIKIKHLTIFRRLGLVQKQTSKMEKTEKVVVRGIRKHTEMDQIHENNHRENPGGQKWRGFWQLIIWDRKILHKYDSDFMYIL